MDSSGNPAPAGRYVVLDPGTGICGPSDGTGRVKDTTTGLVWNRTDYELGSGSQADADLFCRLQAGPGARLPTKDEALAISGDSFDVCAFPCGWRT